MARTREMSRGGNVASISFSVIVFSRKGSMGWKASENLPSFGMRLYVKSEGDACRDVSMMPGYTHTL